jgi:hypothetical protein
VLLCGAKLRISCFCISLVIPQQHRHALKV